MSQIEIKHLTFSYPGQERPLFQDVDLNLDSEWKLGLFGRNGRGKTTLLKLLQGKLEYQGEITQQVDFTYFPQEATDQSQLAIYALSENNSFEEWQLERELNQMGVDPDLLWRPFEILSGGEQTKLMLALLFTDDNGFPLIDEPTNHLDIDGRVQVAEYLKNKKQGFVVVSHDRDFIDACCNHILAIEKMKLELYHGNYSTYQHEKGLRDEYETQQNTKLKKDIGRLKQTSADKKRWAESRESDNHGNPHIFGSGGTGHDGPTSARAARTMKRSKSLKKRMDNEISEKKKLLKNIEFIDPLSLAYKSSHHKTLVHTANLELHYDKHSLFAPVSFNVKRGQCVALEGPNGSGKTSILRALTGKFTGKVTGEIRIPANISISYIRQMYENNTGTLQDFASEHQLDFEMFLNNLHKLGLEREVFNQRIENMSMGQQKRVEVAKSLSQEAELYVWDEPLNYLDTYNQDQLIQLLSRTQPTVLLIEHDQHFIGEVADKVVRLKK